MSKKLTGGTVSYARHQNAVDAVGRLKLKNEELERALEARGEWTQNNDVLRADVKRLRGELKDATALLHRAGLDIDAYMQMLESNGVDIPESHAERTGELLRDMRESIEKRPAPIR